MKELSLLMYTNQTYLPIAKLGMDQIVNNFDGLTIKKYITSNSFESDVTFDGLDVSLIDTNVPFSNKSSHLSKVLIKALEQIDTEYVFLFLDDYYIVNKLKTEPLIGMVSFMNDENIDYLSLQAYDYNDWHVFDVDYNKYNLPENILMKFNYSYFYMFSVQPCIWRRSALIDILTHNEGIQVHELDTTSIKNKAGHRRHSHDYAFWETPDNFWDYGYNFACFKRTDLTKNYAFDERPLHGDYLLFLYAEVIRQGKFNLNTHHNNKAFLENFLQENNITPDDPMYSPYFKK